MYVCYKDQYKCFEDAVDTLEKPKGIFTSALNNNLFLEVTHGAVYSVNTQYYSVALEDRVSGPRETSRRRREPF